MAGRTGARRFQVLFVCSLSALLLAGGAKPGLSLDPRKALTQYVHDVWQAEQGLPQNTVATIVQTRDGYLWLGTQEGLARFDGVRFTVFDTRTTPELAHNSLYALLEDRAGRLWIGTNGGGLVRLEKERFSRYTAKEGLPNEQVRALLEDRRGRIWVGTLGGGVARLEGQRFVREPGTEALSGRRVRALLEDRQGVLWIATEAGLAMLKDGVVTVLTKRDGVSHENVLALWEDREGSLWIGTYGGGLNRLKDGRLTALTTKEGLSNDLVRSLYEDREGSLWIGTDGGGLNRLKDGRLAALTTKEGLANDNVWSLHEDREGSLWIGTQGGGLNRLKDGRLAALTTKDGLSSDVVRALYEDREGSLWIGTQGGGLNRLKDGRLTAFTTKDGLSNDFVMSLHEGREGSLWIGTSGGGLNRLKDGRFTAFTTKEGMSNDRVLSLYEDRGGSLWIGTSGGGLNRLKDGRLASVTAKQGLFDDSVFTILEDDQGRLWMSCSRGVFRVGKRELEEAMDGRRARVTSVSYGTADGMRSAECNGGAQPAGWKTRDGRLWFPTVRGVVVVDPGHLPTNTLPPPVVIEEVLVDESLADRSGSLRLPPGTHTLELHYTALSLLAPERVRFKYRLDGFDREWVDAGARRTAYYTNLPHGEYRFRVIACNNDGLWNEEGASLVFAVDPRLHETWWGRLLGAAVAAVLLLGGARVRERTLRRRAQDLEQAVARRTQDLEQAHDQIARLLQSAPGAAQDLKTWSSGVATDVARAVAARAIEVWALDGDRLVPAGATSDEMTEARTAHVDPGAVTPSEALTVERVRERPHKPFTLDPAEESIVPVSGPTGELCGALLVRGKTSVWTEVETRLLLSFAHQVGGALELHRTRRQLDAAEQRRTATRREMLERGVALLQVCPVCRRCYDHTVEHCEADGRSLESPRLLPYRIAGRYRLLRVLGEGGMGTVFESRDERLDRAVAVKLIRADCMGELTRSRFEQEARVLARIDHPGVIAIFDSGEVEEGSAFLVTELLVGASLQEALRRFGAGTPRQVAALLRQGASALAAAHRAGIVHRDVKPGNVFLVGGEGLAVKLLDFGVAKPVQGEVGLTQTGLIVGTPLYMSPEQISGRGVDARSDLYSFAAVVWEALVGRRLVSGTELVDILGAIQYEPAPLPSREVPGLPEKVDEGFARALAKKPEERASDIVVWAEGLADHLDAVVLSRPGWPEDIASATDTCADPLAATGGGSLQRNRA